MLNRPTTLLLNIGHALDHMFLLIFATAVTSIATDFGIERWVVGRQPRREPSPSALWRRMPAVLPGPPLTR